MTNEKNIDSSFEDHQQLMDQVRSSLAKEVGEIGRLLAARLDEGGTLFWCGNGGSAADSQHLAAELIGRFRENRQALRSMALTTDTSVISCVANDFCYDDVFARQVEGIGRAGDVLIAISTSGMSENILRAIKAAKSMDMGTVALLGKGGGPARELADHSLMVPSDSTARIQEAHILIGHIFCELIESELGFD